MKKGDTLIEIAIAIAIFSLVAIGVISVVNGSTSAAQNALEVTVTREEIDAQAEALRYIHNSYIAGGQSNSADNEKYLALWNELKSHAIDSTTADNIRNAVLNFNPSSCSELYADDPANPNSIFNQHAFIINTHILGSPIDYHNTSDIGSRDFYEGNTITTAVAGEHRFYATSTYPRIMYNSTTGTGDSLLDQGSNDTGSLAGYFNDIITGAEGLYIVAVADHETTTIINAGSGSVSRESAFYDFYIRSCWFAPGAERPSTISTVIRLQDPTLIDYDGATPDDDITIHFHHNYGPDYTIQDKTVAITQTTVAPPNIASSRTGYRMLGWSLDPGASTASWGPTANVPATDGGNYYAVWARSITVSFDPNGGSGYISSFSGSPGDSVSLPTDGGGFSRSGYHFSCWSLSSTGSCLSGTSYTIPAGATSDITIYAIWEEDPVEDYDIVLHWTALGKDLDLVFQNADGSMKVDWLNKQYPRSGTPIIVQLSCSNNDCNGVTTDEDRTETIRIRGLDTTQTWHVYVYNNSRSSITIPSTGATVTVNGTTIDASGATGTGSFWNVFTIRNGRIIESNSITSTPLVSA